MLPRKTFSEKTLIDELLRVRKKLNRTPTLSDMLVSKGQIAACHYANTFGTWNNALIKAGLKVNKIQSSTKHTICTRCKSDNSSVHWYYYNDQTICNKCYCKIYRSTHRNIDKNWRKNNPKNCQIRDRKGNAIRRKFGFNPINNLNTDFEAHHLWLEHKSDFVIFVPIFIHKLYHHNHNDITSMDTPNALALDWWINEDFYYDLFEITGGDTNGMRNEKQKQGKEEVTNDNNADSITK